MGDPTLGLPALELPGSRPTDALLAEPPAALRADPPYRDGSVRMRLREPRPEPARFVDPAPSPAPSLDLRMP